MDSPGTLQERTPESPRHFRIHSCLGRGGHGEVYRATMWREGGVTTEVAVKVLLAELDPESIEVRRLKDEGRLLGALRHPAILEVFDLVLLGGRVALVTEYIEGQDLHRCTEGPDPIPPRALVEVIGQVAEALRAAYTAASPGGGGAMRLIHRDVKPANIRVSVHGQTKLLDFGIARAANMEREARTGTNVLMGSWPYLPPERIREDSTPPTAAMDAYGLGCTLYEGLTGERLMEGRTLLDLYRLLEHHQSFEPAIGPRLAALRGVAPGVLHLLHDLLGDEPTARPSAAQVAQRCEELAEALPGNGLRRWARSRRWPPPSGAAGPLTDLTLTEGSVGLPTRLDDPEMTVMRPSPSSRRLGGAPTTTPVLPRPKATPAQPVRNASRLDHRDDDDEEEPAVLPPVSEIVIDDRHEGGRPKHASSGVGLGVGAALAGTALMGILGLAAIGSTAVRFASRTADTDSAGLATADPTARAVPDPEIAEPEVADPPPEPTPSPAPVPAATAPGPAPVDPRPVEPTVAPEPTEPEPPQPSAPEPTQPEPTGREATEPPAPSEPEPTEAEPTAAPEPSEPERAEPQPADAAVDPGTPGALQVSGALPVELEGDFGVFRSGTPLIPGTYKVRTDFGDGMTWTGQRLEVAPGATVTVTCVLEPAGCTWN